MSKRSVRRVKKRVAVGKTPRRTTDRNKLFNIWGVAIGVVLTLTAVALMRPDQTALRKDFGPRERIPILVPYTGPELGDLDSFPRPFQEYFSGELSFSNPDRFDLAFDQGSLMVRFAPMKSGFGGTLDHPALEVDGISAEDLFSSKVAGLVGENLGFQQSSAMRRKEAAARSESPTRGLAQNLPGGGGRRNEPKNDGGGNGGPNGEGQNDGDKAPDKCVNDCSAERDEGPRTHPTSGPDRLRPVTKVSEPGSLALLGLGLLTIALAVRRLKAV